VVSKLPPKEDPTVALLAPAPELGEGAILLVDSRERAFRVSWEAESDRTELRRALPPGDYRMVGYRLTRKAASGETWWASASAQPIRLLTLRAGETTAVAIDPKVLVRARQSRTTVNVDVRGENRSGLSLYRDGRRIELRFRLLDPEGTARASGTIHYG
jgi:hypothetical protein